MALSETDIGEEFQHCGGVTGGSLSRELFQVGVEERQAATNDPLAASRGLDHHSCILGILTH